MYLVSQRDNCSEVVFCEGDIINVLHSFQHAVHIGVQKQRYVYSSRDFTYRLLSNAFSAVKSSSGTVFFSDQDVLKG